MKLSKYGPRPFGIVLLGTIGVAFALTIVTGLSRSPRTAPHAEAEDDEMPPMGVQRPQMLTGKIDLLRVSPLSVPLQQSFRSLGKVTCHIGDDLSESGVAVWLRGPRGFGGHQFSASIQFNGLPAIPLRMDATTRRGIVVIRIPMNYPPNVTSGMLRITQLGKEMGHWQLRDLPRSNVRWKSSFASRASYGAVGISLRAWRTSAAPRGAIGFQCIPSQIAEPTHANEYWEIDHQSFATPQYGPANSRELSRPWVSYSPGVGPTRWDQDSAYPTIEKSVRIKGQFVHYMIYDEQIRFPGVRLEAAAHEPLKIRFSSGERSMDVNRGQRTYTVRCTHPISAETPSGVKMTIYPSPDRVEPRILGGPPLLVIPFDLEKGQNSPANLPGSPLSKGGRYPVWLTPLSASGTRMFLSGIANAAYRDPQQVIFLVGRDQVVPRKEPQSLGIEIPDPVAGKEMDLVLTIRHRVNLESHPFVLEVPLEPKMPLDLPPAPATQHFLHR